MKSKERCPDRHCVKSARIHSYSGSYFPVFGLNAERYGVSLRIQSECGKMQSRMSLDMDTFQEVRISFMEFFIHYIIPFLSLIINFLIIIDR